MMPADNVRNSKSIPKIKFGLTWVIIVPGAIWAITTYYLPVFGGTLLTPAQTGAATPLILILAAMGPRAGRSRLRTGATS